MSEPMPPIQYIPIDDITRDERLQMRVTMSPRVVNEYAEILDKLPPIKLMLDEDGHYWMYDGWHTYEGHKKKKTERPPCIVKRGSFEDAMIGAANSNQTHGQALTPDDKRKTVRTFLAIPKFRDMTDRALAEVIHFSHPFIGDVRTELAFEESKKAGNSQLETVSNSQQRTGKDGKKYRAKRKATTFTMCDRCSRQGRPACTKCRMKAEQGLEPLAKGQKPKKQGDALVDWKAVDSAYGVLVRAKDDVAKAYDGHGQALNGLRRLLSEWLKAWTELRKKCLKAKPGE